MPFEVPKGWVWTTLESIAIDMADGPFGSNLKREHYTSRKEARIIQLSNIGENGWKEDNTKYTSFKHANEISRSIVKPGEIVIAKMMPAGRAIICPEHEMMFVLSSDAIKYVPSHFVYNRYLLFCINSPIVLSQIQSEVHGVTRARTSIEKLRHYRVPLPPFGEQKRIVKQIEYWLTTIGLLDEGKDRLETLVSQCRERVLSLAFTGKLVPQNPSDEPAIDLLKRINPIFQPSHNLHYEDRIPTGWYPMTFGDVAEYVNGRAFKPEEWEKCGLPIVRIQNLNDSLAEYNYTKGTYEDRYLIHHGDLLFAWAASLDAFIWGGDDAWLNQHIFRVVPKNFILPKYLYYTLKAKIHDFYQRSHGSGMVHITRNTFLKETLILPPRDEQERIITTIEELFFTLDSMIECFTK